MKELILLVGFSLAGGGFLMFVASVQSIRAFPLKNIFYCILALGIIAAGVLLMLQREIIVHRWLR